MSDPKLRHEFVGMMFAVTIGEVGLQIAPLVQAGHFVHYLPAYSHLVLATIVIATSWVGWTLSVAPGARKDVSSVFQWEFLVLLLDVALVIVYFILVRSVNFEKERRIEPAPRVALLILAMFILYLGWDILTKIIIYLKKPEGQWFRNYGTRMLPTLMCVVLAWWIWCQVKTADLPHALTADFALLSLVLLFRASKDLISKCFPTHPLLGPPTLWESKHPILRVIRRARVAVAWTLFCTLGIVLGVRATASSWQWPLPKWVALEIQTQFPEDEKHTETSAPKGQPELPYGSTTSRE